MHEVLGRIAEIRRYPVKSMGGDLLTEATLDALGIPGDRRWALRDVETGKVVSAKHPKHAALLDCRAMFVGGELVVQTPDSRRFALDDRASLDDALSELLGKAVRLDSATGNDGVYESYWPELEGLAFSDVTADFPVAMGTAPGTFVDLAALHIVTTASLAHLQALAPDSAISADRFRPSLVVDGGTAGAFAENDWGGRTATIAGATITFSTAAPRCVMPTLGQGTLPRDASVLRTLAEHNRITFDGFGDFACLGVYAEVTTAGTITVGDDIVVH